MILRIKCSSLTELRRLESGVTPGKRLAALRNAKGLKPHQLYKRVLALGEKIGPTYIPKLEADAKDCSERVSIQYLKRLAKALEVRDFVLASEYRDADIQRDPERVIAEEALEVFLARPDGPVLSEDKDRLRRLVHETGGPKWVDDWPQQYQMLAKYRGL